MGLTHVLFSLFLFLTFCRFGLVSFEAIVLVTLVVGSVLPDLDHPRGLIYSLLGVPIWLRRGVSRVVGQRGVLHSFLASMLVLILGVVIFNVIFQFTLICSLGMFFGFLSHLSLDSLTARGVAWLLPFSRKKVRFTIQTGSMTERIFFIILAALSVILGFPLLLDLFDSVLKELKTLLIGFPRI